MNASTNAAGQGGPQQAKEGVKAGPGEAMAAGGGYAVGGPLGAALGAVVGATPMMARAMAAARAAGLSTVDDLVREAMVNPGVAQALLGRVTPASRDNLARALAAALARSSVLPPIGSDGKRQRTPVLAAGVQNALLPYGGSAAAGPLNLLMHRGE